MTFKSDLLAQVYPNMKSYLVWVIYLCLMFDDIVVLSIVPWFTKVQIGQKAVIISTAFLIQMTNFWFTKNEY